MTQATAPVRFGVIGAGRIGLVHADNIASRISGAELAAVMDINLDAAAKAVGHSGAWVTDDLDRLLAADDVGAVVIASLTSLHVEHIAKAVEAGKPIFCEKPVALDLDETRRVMALVEQQNIPFQIGFNRRFDPGYAAVARAVHNNDLGKPEMFRSQSTDPMPASEDYTAASGGIYLDSVIHDIDVARFVMGDIERVTALGRNLVDPMYGKYNDVDVSILTVEFASGAIGVIQNHRRTVYGHDLRVEVHCAEGKLMTEDENQTPIRRYDSGGVHADYYYFFLERFEDAYRAEIQAFVNSLQTGKAPSPSPVDAVESLRVAVAARRSLHEGCPVRVEDV